MRARLWLTGLLVISAGALVAGAQPLSTSAEPARMLTALMQERHLDAVAARDPKEPGRYIAALYLPGEQILVISTKYPVPTLLDERLAGRAYRDVYMELQLAGLREARIFVEDFQANGLQARPASGESSDIVEQNGLRTVFDGNFEAQQLTEEAYLTRFAAADANYAWMLSRLVAALRPTT